MIACILQLLSCLMARQSIFHIGPISCNFHVSLFGLSICPKFQMNLLHEDKNLAVCLKTLIFSLWKLCEGNPIKYRSWTFFLALWSPYLKRAPVFSCCSCCANWFPNIFLSLSVLIFCDISVDLPCQMATLAFPIKMCSCSSNVFLQMVCPHAQSYRRALDNTYHLPVKLLV